MEKRIVYRVHFTKLSDNLNQLVEVLAEKLNREDGDLFKNLKHDGQAYAFFHALHSRYLKEEQEIVNDGFKKIQEFLLQHVMIDDKSELLLDNMSLTDIKLEDPHGYFIKFIFS